MISAIVLRTQSDERLSALAADGSERAFEVIVSRYRRDLVAYCSRLLRSDSRGEDVVQQALLNAWIALRDGTGVRELKPWLYRIAYNQAISARRRPGHEYEQLSEIADGSDHEFDRRMELRETLAAVAALPDLQRRAIMQTSVRGDSYEAAAETLGVSEKALRGLVYRARQRVRAAVAAVAPFPLGVFAAQSRRRIGLWHWLGDLLGAGAPTGGSAIAIKGVTVLASSALIVGGGLIAGTPPHPVVGRVEHPTSATPARPAAKRPRSVSASRSATATATVTATARAADAAAPRQPLGHVRLLRRPHVSVSLAASTRRARAVSAMLPVTSDTGAAARGASRSDLRAGRQAAGRTAAAVLRSPSPQPTAGSIAAQANTPGRATGSPQTEANAGSPPQPDQAAMSSMSSVTTVTSDAQPTAQDPASDAEPSQSQTIHAEGPASPQPAGAQPSSPTSASP
jgi:RNA polymerase sigma factor (sigma-70 family)